MSFNLTVINKPALCWDNPKVQDSFCQLVPFKIDGYRRMFGETKVIPVDSHDFVGTHFLLYWESHLVMAYKMIGLEDCNQYNLAFPPCSLVLHGVPFYQQDEFNSFYYTHKHLNMSYSGGLTVGEYAVKNPDVLYGCLEIMHAIVVHSRDYYGFEYSFMTGAAISGTQKTFLKLGAKPFPNTPAIRPTYYNSESTTLFIHSGNFSDYSTGLAEKYSSLWINRNEINPPKAIDQAA